MNIFWRELKAYRTSTIIWVVSLSLLVVMFFNIFPSFASDVEQSQKLLTNLPEAIRSALDISLSNFFTAYGFFAYLLTFVSVAGAVQALNLGVGVISKEDSGKTTDFLLTKPISRFKVVTSKIAAIFCLLVITNLVFSAVSLVAADIASTAVFDWKTFLLLSASLFLIQTFFMSLGLLSSVIIPRVKSAVVVSLPVAFGFFIIGTLGTLVGNDTVKYISPFKFYDPGYIMNHKGYEPKFLIIEAVLVIATIVLSYVIYLRKDIKAAS